MRRWGVTVETFVDMPGSQVELPVSSTADTREEH